MTPLTFETLSGRSVAWRSWPGTRAGTIDHIALGRWCQVVVVAPATADFLARWSGGRADDLATSLLLALEPRVPVLCFPAMNPQMWNHPATRRNVEWLRSLTDRHVHVGEPVDKEVACGEYGAGGLAEPRDIVAELERYWQSESRGA